MVIGHLYVLVKFCSCSPKLSALRYPKNESPHKVQLFMGITRGTYTTLAISRVPVSLTGELGMFQYSFIYTTRPCQCNWHFFLLTAANYQWSWSYPISVKQSQTTSFWRISPSARDFPQYECLLFSFHPHLLECILILFTVNTLMLTFHLPFSPHVTLVCPLPLSLYWK